MIDVQEVKVPELNQQQKNPRYFHNIETRHKSGQVFLNICFLMASLKVTFTVKVCLLSVNPKFN